MKEDYFESDEFKELLNSYEETKNQGYPSYLDEDDYADLSDYFMNKGNAEQAMECADEGLETHPDSVLMQSVKSGLLIFFHRYEEAKEIIDAIPSDIKNLDVFYQRAQLVYALDKDTDLAEELFREWIELQKVCDEKSGVTSDENIRDSYIHVITSFVELTENRQYDDELLKRWIEEYLVIFPSIGSCNADIILSEIVREERLFDMIEKVYLKILETDPYAPNGYSILATAQNALGKIQDSIESCNFALAIDARDWEAMAVLAHNNFLKGDYQSALTLIEEVNKELGDYSQSLLYSKCLCMCNRDKDCFEQLRNTKEYAQSFKYTLPDYYADIYCEIADIYMMCEDNTDALVAIDESLSMYPNDPHYILEKGVILARVGEDMELADSYVIESINNSEDKLEAVISAGIRLLMSNSIDLAYKYLSIAKDYKAETQEDFYRKKVIPAYIALIHYKKQSLEEFLLSIQEACTVCPELVASLFAEQIPENIAPSDFYEYLINKLKDIMNVQDDNSKE